LRRKVVVGGIYTWSYGEVRYDGFATELEL